MMVWLVDLHRKVENFTCENENLDEIFYEYLCEGYTRFMEGKEDDADNFEDKIKKFYQGENKKMEEMKIHLDRINQRVQELESIDFPNNKQKLVEMEEDKKSILSAENGLDENISKLKEAVLRLTDEYEKAEMNNRELKEEQEELIYKIQEQPINPNEVKEMNSEKVELLKEIEAIKPKKEEKFQLCKKVEQEFARAHDELENLKYDLRNLYPIDEECPKKIIEILEDVLVNKKIELGKLADYKSELEEKRVQANEVQKDLEKQLKQVRDKLFRTGKIYFDKKELSEIEQRRCKKEMENLENDLSKLNLESENSLLISEQSLQRAKINLDRLNNRIEVEKERINTEIYKFFMNTSAMIEKIEELNKIMIELTNGN
ncbi:putative kinetochore protein NDC80 [Dictyocoela muelleri]|nr:putative kinetochore protein NDC80 [Dictyocoela muelleri]